ncbi:MAG: polysaccharide biosynthesis tyrosine autokinase [Desulfuromonadales bacterium]|nr:polysaccharide biosynthesis tyrosine autokinase [Desulfuromonadales bacterium]
MMSTPQLPPQQNEIEEVHLTDYLHVILRRRRIFLILFLTIFSGVTLYTFLMKPIYGANSTLYVKDDKGAKGGILGELAVLNSSNPLDAEIEILKSRTNAEEVVKRLSLDQKTGEMEGQEPNFNATVDGLRKAIKVSEVGKKTNIINVSYTNTDPILARDIVNTLVQVYLDQSLSSKTEEASRTVTFIEEQLHGTRDELERSEKNLQSYKSTTGVVKLDTEAEELIKKLSAIEKERAAVILQRKQTEFALTALQEAARKGEIYAPVGFRDDPQISAMANRLTDLAVQKGALISGNTENHPQVKALQSQIDELQRKIQSTYETARLNLGRQEISIAQQIKEYEDKLRTLPAAERDLAGLMRFSKVNADIYTFLLQKHEEARIAKASTISNIKVVDPAITPDNPLKPQKKKNLLLGLLLGLMAGVGAVFFIEYLDDTIKGPEEAQRLIGAPLLAVIPFIDSDEEQQADLQTAMITHLRPKSAIAEAFRSLRTSLHFSAINREKQILIVTSTFPGEGKSTIAANLAITLSQTGARVLVIDGDLRRPSLHSKFKHSKIPGLSELLAGDVASATVLHDTGIANLTLMTAGTIPPNPAELLGSEKMADLLTALRAQYDHIIIDAPPVLAVTDAPLLTNRCDLVLVVLETERVPVKAAQRMVEMLANVQAPVGGIVINDKSNSSMERYGYYGRNYSTYDYYAEDEESQAELSRKRKQKVWWKRVFRG